MRHLYFTVGIKQAAGKSSTSATLMKSLFRNMFLPLQREDTDKIGVLAYFPPNGTFNLMYYPYYGKKAQVGLVLICFMKTTHTFLCWTVLLGPSFCRWTTLSLWWPLSSLTSLITKTSTSSARSTPTTFPPGVTGTSLPDECLSSWESTLKSRLTFWPLLKAPFFILCSIAHCTQKQIAVFTPFVRFVYNPHVWGHRPVRLKDKTRIKGW